MSEISTKILLEIRQLRSELKGLQEKFDKLDRKVQNGFEEIKASFEDRYSSITDRVESIDRKLRKNNIVIYGLETNSYTTPVLLTSVITFFKKELDIEIRKTELNDVYAIGKSHQRPVIVEFVSYLTKREILQETNKLKGKNLFINHDLTRNQQKIGKVLRGQLKIARKEDPKAYIKRDKIYSRGEVFTVEDFPDALEQLNIHPVTTEKPNSAPATPVSSRDLNLEFNDNVIPDQLKNNRQFEKKNLRSNSSNKNINTNL